MLTVGRAVLCASIAGIGLGLLTSSAHADTFTQTSTYELDSLDGLGSIATAPSSPSRQTLFLDPASSSAPRVLPLQTIGGSEGEKLFSVRGPEFVDVRPQFKGSLSVLN